MKKIVNSSMFIILCFILTSCAPTIERFPISKDNAVKLQKKTWEISKYKTPDFYAQTADKVWLGPIIGISASYSLGREIAAQNNLEDPANYISQEMTKILKEKFDVQFLPASDGVSEDNNIDTLVKKYNRGNFLLDLRTTGWGFGKGKALAAFSTKYYVSLGVQMRIIDIKANEVLAGELFFYPNPASVDANKTFSYDELINNNAEGIKIQLRKAADEAVLFFKEKVLNL